MAMHDIPSISVLIAQINCCHNHNCVKCVCVCVCVCVCKREKHTDREREREKEREREREREREGAARRSAPCDLVCTSTDAFLLLCLASAGNPRSSLTCGRRT